MRMVLVSAVLCVCGGAVAAQEAVDRCAGLLDASLIDRSSSSSVRQIAESEFNSLCSQEGSLMSSYEGSSFSLSGSMDRYGASGALGYDETSGVTEEFLRNVCDEGSRAFSDFLAQEQQSSSGAFVAQQYNACVQTLVTAGQSFLTGQLLTTGRADRFTVLFRYEAGRDGARTVRLDGLSGDPITCLPEIDGAPIGPENTIEFSGERSITCELPEGQDAAGGTFRFTSPNGPSREVVYSYVARDLVAEMEARIAAEYAERVAAAVPAGQVSMFALSECPAGWRLHDGLAAGRVPVGAPDGTGAEVGAAQVAIPRDALPRVGLRLPVSHPETATPAQAAGDPYALNTRPNAVLLGPPGNYQTYQRWTEYMGRGQPLQLPTPPGIALLPCVRL